MKFQNIKDQKLKKKKKKKKKTTNQTNKNQNKKKKPGDFAKIFYVLKSFFKCVHKKSYVIELFFNLNISRQTVKNLAENIISKMKNLHVSKFSKFIYGFVKQNGSSICHPSRSCSSHAHPSPGCKGL